MKTKLSVLLVGLLLLSCEEDEHPAIDIVPDLAADSISFSVESINQFSGYATIIGTVKNLGANYMSGEGRQSISLYEGYLGAPNLRLVAQKNFTNLNSGDTLQILYTRYWMSSSPAEGEFPPNYVLQISYDPDFGIDRNPFNDDKNMSNNRLTVSGAPINDLL